MNKIKKWIAICGMLVMLIGLCPGVSAAWGRVSLSGATSATVGQTVTVTATLAGADIGSFTGTIYFDSSKLSCTNAAFVTSGGTLNIGAGSIAVTWADVNGSSSISISLTFKAIAAGSAAVRFSVNDCYGIDFAEITGIPGTSSAITVSQPVVSSKPSSSQASSKPSSSQSSKPASSKPSSRPSSSQSSSSSSSSAIEVKPILVTVDGKQLQVQPSLIGMEIPDGYEVRQDEYQGQEIDVASGINEEILLMYLTDTEGKNGAYYQYNRKTNTFYPFLRVQVPAARYTAMPLPESVSLPQGWKATTVTLYTQTIPAYQSANAEYYLLYLSNAKGEVGFYLYDAKEGTVQRYMVSDADAPVITPAIPDVEQTDKNVFERILADREIFLIVMVSLTLVVLIAAAWFVVQLSRKRAVVSDEKRKSKEEKITQKLEKRAARQAKKQGIEPQAPEIGTLDDEFLAVTDPKPVNLNGIEVSSLDEELPTHEE